MIPVEIKMGWLRCHLPTLMNSITCFKVKVYIVVISEKTQVAGKEKSRDHYSCVATLLKAFFQINLERLLQV